ncbi:MULTISPECIES: helix-turn-helix transcriptional regulator [Actinoplanes]|uniref:helix-turn-helix domain-containing protein n=1 Tax=Actinoplanes TaxID=1865 RepID=UPI0006979DD6|nr:MULTISPECIES: helix-turn-helix transcriptional regulator [Actinoplanes]GLY07737.1 hypothetical protein Acsp01_81160 [Actinoplanes sp. NBRC 101535]
MSDSPTFTGGTDEPVGAALARWRKRKDLSGQALGAMVGISQAKISRLENSVSTPDPQDVRRIAEAMELPDDEIERLVALADRSSEQLVDWHSTEPGLPERQQYLRHLESSTREVRIFQPAVVVGLLQTSEYARAILTALRTELADDQIADSEQTVSAAVTARMERSQVLYDPHREFRFIMAEAVLTNQVCEPADMLAQIERLRKLAELPNIDIRFVPQDAVWSVAPFHGFELMGDRQVFVDLFNTSLVSRGRRTVRHYQRVFESFESVAETDIGPVLDAHQKRYLRILQEAVA